MQIDTNTLVTFSPSLYEDVGSGLKYGLDPPLNGLSNWELRRIFYSDKLISFISEQLLNILVILTDVFITYTVFILYVFHL